MSSLDIPKETRYKGKTDLVTEIDIKSEKIIKSIISSSFKYHSIWAEETGKEETTSDYVWIIDPLDGTTNFVHGYPPCGISIGVLCEESNSWCNNENAFNAIVYCYRWRRCILRRKKKIKCQIPKPLKSLFW